MRYVYAFVAGLGIVAAIAVWWMLSSVNHVSGTSSDQTTLTIAKGEQLRSVARELESQKLIPSAGAWTLYAITQGQRSGILAGDYILDHGMSGRQILHILTTQDSNDKEVTVKILEGSTNVEIARLLEQKGVVSAEEFLAAANVTDSRVVVDKVYSFLADKPATANLEGYLFPDTYRFFKKSSAAAVVQKFLDNFDVRVTATMRQAATASGRTLFEELTMAAIIEKELKSDADRAMGADVFWKRIALGMPLQADATVNFSTGKNTTNVSNTDTQTDSLYNTYKYKGLPPGPINNPSLSALRAAISPKTNPYYYYLTAPDGTTYFAKTLEEHNQYKAKYLK